MKSGESLREGFKHYLNNPVLILPYLLFGLFSLFLYNFSINFARESFSILKITSPFQILLLQEEFADTLSAIILRNVFFFILVGIIYALVDSFVKAYTIGLSEKISRTGGAKLKDGFQGATQTLQIFGKNIILILLLLFGFGLLLLTTAILLAQFALLAFIPAAIIYAFIIYSVSFFASQSIVVEKKGPWGGIVSSYAFIKRNMEDVAKLILFILFVYVAFHVIRLASLRLFEHFFVGATMRLISVAENLLLGYIIMRPYFVILKTLYFIKNQRFILVKAKEKMR
ncbi:TPA: hypothetical protein H1005_01685 [archaeon]|uniref:Glycerophosphoryl diester phosphodiesterase membrane domain-containing protein n=1 Tax=Candidatus Naiadarchaeum limnaeum TaxID=2756139 RepID=A0A832URX2_9ARCH|nr:hypothetical protein [Candidatus Naiadarchaeales archaeon SRR2090153.bin1042]HIK00452.1 hypothetical protein [Candidatus Naiadarchaeum limnaeum]